MAPVQVTSVLLFHISTQKNYIFTIKKVIQNKGVIHLQRLNKWFGM